MKILLLVHQIISLKVNHLLKLKTTKMCLNQTHFTHKQGWCDLWYPKPCDAPVTTTSPLKQALANEYPYAHYWSDLILLHCKNSNVYKP